MVSQTAIMKTVIIEDKQRIESIILHCDACFVGITDLEGNPYVVPMNFGYENGIIYLHSGPEGSKLEMLEHNNNVCITFSVGHKLVYQHEKVACSYSMRSESAMCRGQVEFIEEIDEKRKTPNYTLATGVSTLSKLITAEEMRWDLMKRNATLPSGTV